jgi:membrane-associated phospholipid phosphatase
MRDSRATWWSVAFGVIGTACAVWVLTVGPLPGEQAVADWRLGLSGVPSWATPPVDAIIALGSPVAVGVTLAGFAGIGFRAGGARTVVLVAAGALAGPAALALKAAIGRTMVLGFREGHMPSAHTAYVASVFGLAAILAAKAGHRAGAALLWLCVVSIGPALVIQGAHLASDVVTGYCLGMAWMLAALAVAGPSARLPDPR